MLKLKSKLIAVLLAMLPLLPSVTLAQDFEAGLEAYVAGDHETALKEWQPMAEQGDARAQLNLGMLHYEGKGVTQDYAEAAKWYRLAAKQGLVRAQGSLGISYAQGKGVPQDFFLAHMWLNLAAANGTKYNMKIIGMNAGIRDILAAEHLSPTDILKAQAMARECLASNYENCE